MKNNYVESMILCLILLKHVFHFIRFQVENEPPLEMTTAMFANISKGLPNNYVPYSDHGDTGRTFFSTPEELIQTYNLPSGIGATCVLESARWNDSLTTKYQDSCYRAMSEFGVAPPDYDMDSLHYKYLKGDENDCCSSVRGKEKIIQGTALHFIVVEGRKNHSFKHFLCISVNDITGPLISDKNVQNSLNAEDNVQYYPDCQCYDDDRGLDCSDDNYRSPPSLLTVTQDIMQNITGQSESDYIYYTTDIYRLSR